jgi:hypothetical protein
MDIRMAVSQKSDFKCNFDADKNAYLNCMLHYAILRTEGKNVSAKG